ncbi:carbonic anhydrase 1-like [Belonocnema kinseyi]|uniref:carbonic anhydrase 1-like n=1 Tax=Belonocnema kinseyi TaxID=2817044 RepID=UPI00143DF577|nr:carbonic anhydrase 1-like [Belonocnema kinseyi]
MIIIFISIARKKWAAEVVPEDDLKDYYMIDMEMHIFFYKKDSKSIKKAYTQKGGLAAIKIGLKILDERGPTTIDNNYNKFYENLGKNLHKVQSTKSSAKIPSFPFASTFLSRVPPYLFYEGSLDHPPCDESVTWFISDGSLITKDLLNEFRKINLDEGDKSNVRPPQALNKREVKSVNTYKSNEE